VKRFQPVTGVGLRDISEADLPFLWEQQQDEVANHMAAFTVEDPSDRAAFDHRWSRIFADTTLIKRIIVFDGKVVGSIFCHRWFGEPEVSYGIDRPQWGRGIATEALRRFLEQIDDRPLYARVAADNLGSIRVLEKCGFQLTGYERAFANARGEEIDEGVFILNGA